METREPTVLERLKPKVKDEDVEEEWEADKVMRDLIGPYNRKLVFFHSNNGRNQGQMFA